VPVRAKIDLPALLAAGKPLQVEIGCGPAKRAGFLGIDALDHPGVELVGDLDEALALLPERSVGLLVAEHVLEHVADLDRTLRSIARVLRDDGAAEIAVPHFSNPLGWSDPTHRRAFGLYSFLYYCAPARQPLRRKVPSYASEPRFLVDSLRLRFRPPRKSTSLASRWLTRLINSSARVQELYEARWCWLVPCYEVRVVLRQEERRRIGLLQLLRGGRDGPQQE
jgi:SAM-dependent methyltransferase